MKLIAIALNPDSSLVLWTWARMRQMTYVVWQRPVQKG